MIRVNKYVAGAFISAVLGLEAWTLQTVIDLKVQVAEIKAQLAVVHKQQKNELANHP